VFRAFDRLGAAKVAQLNNIMGDHDGTTIGAAMWALELAAGAKMCDIADVVVGYVTEGDYTTVRDLSDRVLDLIERCGELQAEVAQLKGTDYKTHTTPDGETIRVHSEPLDEAFERVDRENQDLRAVLANLGPMKSDAVREAVAFLIFRLTAAAGPDGLHRSRIRRQGHSTRRRGGLIRDKNNKKNPPSMTLSRRWLPTCHDRCRAGWPALSSSVPHSR
jgi:hypothetical protein